MYLLFFKKLVKAPFRLLSYFVNKIRFGSCSLSTQVMTPLRINGARNIYLGKNVVIKKFVWMGTKCLKGNMCPPKIIIKDGSCISDFAHIYATGKITIEENVLIAHSTYISDNLHGFEDITTPIIKQPIIQKQNVTIGEGSWLGEHACVIGANVGKHCIIGANSVVTHDIPDYSVAVGSPAKVIKRYNFETGQWEKVKR